MKPRERVLTAIDRKPVDRTPTDIWATPEVQQSLQQHFGCARFTDTYDYLGIDGIIDIKPEYVGPKLADLGHGLGIDEWGIVRKWQPHATGGYWEYESHPLAKAETIADIDAYDWPQPEWYDYSVLRDRAAEHPDRAIMYGYIAIFFYHNLLRGLELSLMDLALRPEFTAHFIRRLSQTFFDLHQAGFEAAGDMVHITQVTDDFGSQQNLLISRRMFSDVYRPWMQQAIDLVKSHGHLVFHHDDGAIRELIPDFIEMGIDVLNPVQWRCEGMEQEGLARDFGDRLCFHGGMDNQQTLPFGTEAEVRAEVVYNLSTLGRQGTGYILAPCHNLQPNTPLQNIIAMYDEASKIG